MHPIVDTLLDRLGDPFESRGKSGVEYRFCCPFPHPGGAFDDKYRMYVNPAKRKWTCYRCERGGDIEVLFRLLGLELSRPSVGRWTRVLIDLRDRAVGVVGAAEEVDDTPQPIEYEAEPFDLRPKMSGWEYLIGRGLSPKLIRAAGVVQGTERLDECVIFPVRQDGAMVYWVARDYSGRRAARYQNAKASRARILYHHPFTTPQHRRAVIVEGILSALGVGPGAVATLGKHVSGPQLGMLLALDVDEYVVAIERDARKRGLQLARRLASFAQERPVRVVDWPDGEDSNSLDQVEVDARVAAALPIPLARTLVLS